MGNYNKIEAFLMHFNYCLRLAAVQKVSLQFQYFLWVDLTWIIDFLSFKIIFKRNLQIFTFKIIKIFNKFCSTSVRMHNLSSITTQRSLNKKQNHKNSNCQNTNVIHQNLTDLSRVTSELQKNKLLTLITALCLHISSKYYYISWFSVYEACHVQHIHQNTFTFIH